MGGKPPRARRQSGLLEVFFILVLANTASVRAEDWRDWEGAKIRLHVARAAVLHNDFSTGLALSAAMDSEQREVRLALDNLNRTSPPPRQSGIRLEAYISEIDDSPQPFWRYLPPEPATQAPPLLVFLHGYNPYFNLASDFCFPTCMTNLANRTGAAIVAPFGRGNTDFQHIGEQDVLRVIDEMHVRYGIDPERVVLAGMSMGGLGAWCIGSRWADRFNALLIFCGRGDFYVWHKLGPGDLPGWQRELVDTQFATRYLDRLLELPILATHGRYDDIVSYEQGVFPAQELLRLGAKQTRFITFSYAGHDVFGYSWFHQPVQQFLEAGLTRVNAKPPPRTAGRPGATGSRLQDAFLSPFIFIGGDENNNDDDDDNVDDYYSVTKTNATKLQERAWEWESFAFARPRTALESDLDLAQAAQANLFVFGEPETSPLIRRILETGGVLYTDDTYTIAGRTLPRADHGLWFTGINPFNSKLTAVVQTGIAWGQRLPVNHRYDRIPDVIVYSADTDRWGSNVALAAGFIGLDQRVRWSDPPFTEAIRRPPDLPIWTYDDEAVRLGFPAADDDEDNAPLDPPF